VPQHTSHLTTEQISTFLDQQLSAQKQSTCQAHLNTCQHCQQQLTELEQTVLLVRSLPQVPLPRSFVLPTASTEQSQDMTIKGNIAPRIARQARNHVLIFPRARTTMRIASTLVAVLGLFFTLSGLLTIIFPNAANFLVSAPSSKIVQVRIPLPTPLPLRIFVGAKPPLMGAEPPLVGAAPPPDTQSKGEATPSPNKVQKQTPSHVSGTYQQFFDPSTPEGHLSIGLLLLILGAVSVIYFTK